MPNYTPQQIEEFLREFFDVVGTRQYVGARYVPMFGRRGESSIEWDNTAPYEPLTIVTHEGNSYTSRTYVPAGIAIDNESYWVLTGAYNAQVEMYREEVVRLQGEWVDWKTDTEGDISEWEGDVVDGLNDWKADTVADFETAIGNLPAIIPSSAFDAQNTVKDYIDNTKRIALYIGNSYTMGTGNNNQGIFYKTKDIFNEAYMYALSSTGFCQYDGEVTVTNTFNTCLQNAKNGLTEEQRNSITDIMVFSAVGDDRAVRDNNLTNYQTSITNFCNYAATHFPHAIIHVFLCSAAATYGAGDVYPWTINAVDLILGYLGRSGSVATRFVYHGYCGGRINLISPDFFSSDEYHPSENGYNCLCQEIVTRYFGGIYYKPQGYNSYGYKLPFAPAGNTQEHVNLLIQNIDCGKVSILFSKIALDHLFTSTMYSKYVNTNIFKETRWNTWSYKFISKPISSGYSYINNLVLLFNDGTSRICPCYMNIEESSSHDDNMHAVLYFENLFPSDYTENTNGQTLISVYPNLVSISWASPYVTLDYHTFESLPAYA